jgi:hypothetical protein
MATMARRSRSPIFVGVGQFRDVKGLARVMRKIAAIDPAVVAAARPGVERAGDRLVKRIKSIVPVSDLETTPGQLRDSVRKERGDHDLAVVVIEDARDEKGRFIPKHVEHGHKARDGSHVAAVPHFWPSYRVERKAMRSQVGRAMSQAAKKAFASK